LGNHPLHHAGAFYVQEPSAMEPVRAVPIKPDFLVLDICASPGGKSAQAAEKLESGIIVSNEIIPSRAVTLMGNTERLGYRNSIVTNTDAKTLAEFYDETFDLVICDAPCSGEGMFRKSPDAVAMWSEANVKYCAERQAEILSQAKKTVCGGGYLLYSTCTFSREENEENVEKFLDENADFELLQTRRFYPHTSDGEGQFYALMRKRGEKRGSPTYRDGAKPLSKEESKTVSAFLSDCFDEIPRGRIGIVGKYVCILPDFPVPPHSVYAAGVKIGEIEKGRVIPHHQLFSAYGAQMKRKINLDCDSDDVKKFISGNVIASSCSDGYTAVLCNGASLGGGKTTCGVLKNYYPKGLRKNI
ncbi:MAG: hypothetical protein KBS59_02995, partial [Clostridiales bacterium]|nr:hypothetical protein [Clostridiales bacterium]